ncbi:MAG TPA: dienelactone hydrolase family protein [Brevundimonas sp.]|jgi:carboxymethylenebutenolidase|uniref:dienelactone hydrolase family protein n=1 Tax=Brevundimonas sp. TaxID=1871086 RepID=UPI002C877D55|nr:dienelactone hydrolase family protein [Brevundimonas sp.]HRH19653.1 dienelactone hydrolase family protein [Brevundimonas sp.]
MAQDHLPTPEGPKDLKLTRRTLGGLMFTGYAAAALGAQARPVVTDETGILTDQVSFVGWSAEAYAPSLPAYVARPEGDGPFPVVIVVNEIFGLHAYIQDVCRRLAKQGYVAMAPGYFARAGDPSRLTDFAAIREIVATATHDQVMGDTGAALQWLAGQPWADVARAGITGFCWGGTVVWMACAAHDFKAGAAFYGRLVASAPGGAERPWPVDIAGDLRCPVIGLYGETDQGIPLATVEQMRAALAAAGRTDSEIVVYPGADHGFHADYRPMYNAAAATDAWSRLSALFARQLGGRPA